MHYRYLYLNHDLKKMAINLRLSRNIETSNNIVALEMLRNEITRKVNELVKDKYELITMKDFETLSKRR